MDDLLARMEDHGTRDLAWKALRRSRVAVVIATLALLIAIIAIFR